MNLQTEKMYHPKVEFCFIQHTFLECQVREATSQVSRRKLLEVGGEPGYLGVLQLLNVKRLLLMKENQIAWVKELSAFPGVGRCKSLGSLKWSSHVPVSSLGPVSFLCHWHRCLGIAGLVLLPGCPGGQESVQTVAFLFIDVAENTPFSEGRVFQAMSWG